jgi:hypothetical protein
MSRSRLLLVAALALACRPAFAQPLRLDVGAGGLPADGPSLNPVVSADGRYVAFVSTATNLVPGVAPDVWNLYRFDRTTGTLIRAALRALRVDEPPRVTAISHDGRLVLFSSFNRDWIAGDTNETQDVFHYDFTTGETRRLSVSSSGEQANGGSLGESMSVDGRYVVFTSSATNLGPPELGPTAPFVHNVFVHDAVAHTTIQVTAGAGRTPANGSSLNARISPDGEWVVFASRATNLAGAPPRPSTNDSELYLVGWRTGEIMQAGPAGGTGSYVGTPTWDAGMVMFPTAPGLVIPGAPGTADDLFIWDRATAVVDHATLAPSADGVIGFPGISAHGRYVTRVQADGRGRPVLVHHDRLTRRSTALNDGPSADLAPMSLDGRWVAFTRLDAVYLMDMQVPRDGRLPTADDDSDGLPNEWEERFGLDPLSNATDDGPDGDPDHDGRTNAEERAAGTHPRGFQTRLLAEGASNAFFRTRFALLSTSATTAHVWLRFLLDGGEVSTLPLVILPGAHRTVETAWISGLAGRSFSTVVESDAPVVVNRTMSWDAREYGAHAETAVAAPATTWYLAEGSTSGDFALFYLLQSPGPASVEATVTFVRPFGLAPIVRAYTLPPDSRTTIAVDGAGAELASTDVSAVITASQPIVVERAMYLSGPGAAFTAGLGSAGVTAAATRWILAEGATGPFFDTFLLLLNPGDAAASCEVRYATTTGSVFVKPYVLAPHSRTTIWMDAEDIPGAGRVLANVSAATTVTSTNGVPIVVERTMWWPDGGWYEAHSSAGAVAPSRAWAVAGLELGPAPRAADAYILVLNTSATAGTVLVTLRQEDGLPLAKAFAVAPFARLTVRVRDDVPAAQTFTRPFGAVVEAIGPDPIDIVVEQAVYWNAGGVVWAAGTNALGTPLPD